jgi:SAM-dependent methyltransferase
MPSLIEGKEKKMRNEEQPIAWNGTAGGAWVAMQGVLDAMFAPLEVMLAEAVPVEAQVLDIGCGTGATTIAAARRAESALGVDISEPMIAAARARAEREGAAARFLCADAQEHGFAAGRFDRVVSRFGVMFFADPVRAFANLRRATAAEGRLHAIVWRGAAENPFMTAAEHAAAPLLPDLPVRDDAAAQGQFAFADAVRVRGILAAAGWLDVAIDPVDADCSFPAAGLPDYVTRLGPVARALDGADAALRMRVAEAVLPAFDRFVAGDRVNFTAACWSITACA